MSTSNPTRGKVLRRANPSTIQDKFLVGYQGWFTCAGDGEPVNPGHHGWLHWFNYPVSDGGRPTIDLWPDVSNYSPSELYPAPGMKSATGEQLFLFSSRHPKTVQRHFHWMAEHGVDGAFLQRFAGQCDLEAGNYGIMRIRDEVGDRVKEAAEKEGRVFAIMYDVSGVAPNRIQRIIERDWIHLIRDKGILDSPNYLREKGKAVVAIWGFGFHNAGHTPDIVRAVTSFIRSNTPGGAYIMGGAPSQWRTAEGDADRNSAFLDVWLTEFDAISPWTVGRYCNEEEADRFANGGMKADLDLLKRRWEDGNSKKIDYIPVVLPGGSGYNLSEGKWSFNNIKRNRGQFLWRQIVNARRLGVRIMYGAMWDEYDEGTAFLPAVPSKRQLPAHERFPFLALDEEGYDLPSDWYMRICGFAVEGLRSERLIQNTFPVKELQDYWATRPVFEEYEDSNANRAPGLPKERNGGDDQSSARQSYQDWLASQKDDQDKVPPPPYTLVAEENSAPASQLMTVTAFSEQGSAPLRTSSMPAQIQVTSTPPVNAPASPVSSSSPPPINTYTRPLRPATNDPVTCLASDFGRQTISGSPAPHRMDSLSRPPVHPSHPAAPYPPKPLSTHPLSQIFSPSSTQPQPPETQLSQSSIPSISFPSSLNVEEPQNSGPWTQAPWPPPEWKTPQHGYQSHQVSYSLYPGQMTNTGPDAHGHQSLNPSFASSSELPVRLHSVIGAPSIRPSSSSPNPMPTGNSPPNFPMAKPSGPYSAALSPGGPSNSPYSFPSGPDDSSHSTYLGKTSAYTSHTPPMSTYPGPASSPPSSPLHLGGVNASYPVLNIPNASAYSSQIEPRPYPPSPSHGGISYPQDQPIAQHSQSGQGYSQQQTYHAPGYMPNFVDQTSISPYHDPHFHTSGTPNHDAGNYYLPGRPGSAVPLSVPPPRPPSSKPPYSMTSTPGPSFPGGASATAINMALSAVDMVAGRQKRQQLEQQVGNLAQSGTKLFNKFTR
ncbi:hypothetical protein AX17_006335 [Amanita inopinata Kibby_2008]|nr:hypothetical protein AX17_006335 [Amanita inopinata Kibby_2008]